MKVKPNSSLFSLESLLHYAANNGLALAAFRKPNSLLTSLWIGGISKDILFSEKAYLLASFSEEPSYTLIPKWEFTAIDNLFALNEGFHLEIDAVTASQEQFVPTRVFPEFINATYQDWEEQIACIQNIIANGGIQKAVLSRCITHSVEVDFSISRFFFDLIKNYPNAFVNLYYSSVTGMWIGSSPETLISVNENQAQTVSLAGTKPLRSNTFSFKELEEQQFVTDFIAKALIDNNIDFATENPEVVVAGPVEHLVTKFYFELKSDSALSDLVFSLHPTPAVCGVPTTKAKNLIEAIEQHKRYFYAGFCGPFEPSKRCDLFVNLRNLHLADNKATLFVGAGVTALSDALMEWEETVKKLNTLLPFLHLQDGAQ